MNDRLGELLAANDLLYCMLCRDATAIDIELYAQEGYHIVWLDLEHSAQSTDEVLRLGRTVSHLGMVPLVRVLELSRTHLQRLLDGGIPIVNLPDIRSADEARELVRLGKYPPMGVGSDEQARHYYDLGVRVFSIGADVSVKRRAYAEAIAPLKAAFGSG